MPHFLFRSPMKMLEATVYPSLTQSIAVLTDGDAYGGAHRYIFNDSVGFQDGQTQYANTIQMIQFVHKAPDGEVTPGLLSEQVVLALIDRHEKLDARFPSPHNQKGLAGLRQFLEASRERVDERVARGVMGDLKA